MVNATSPLPAARSVASLRFFMKFRAPQALKDNLRSRLPSPVSIFGGSLPLPPAGGSMEDHKQSTEVDARRVFESLQQATLARDHKISDLFADDGVIEWPFARP